MAQSNLISARIAFERIQETIDQLKSMGSAGEAAIKQIQQAAAGSSPHLAALGKEADGLRGHFSEIGRAVENLTGVLGPAIGRFNRFTHEFADLRGIIAVLGPAMKEFAEVSVGVGLFLAAKKGSEAIRELNDQAKILGVTIESLQKLQFAGSQAGVDAEKFTKGFERFTAKVGEAKKAREEFAEKSGLLAGQELEESLKTASAIARAQEARDRAQRSFAGAAAEAQKATLAQQQLNVSTDQYTVAQKKLHDERLSHGTVGIALGPNLQTQIKDAESEIKIQQARISASEASRHATNSAIEAQNNLRAANDRLREAQVSASNATEKHRIEAEKQRDVFQRLGVDISKTADVSLLDFIEKLGKMDDATKRNAISREVFGRDWMQMGKFVTAGIGEIRKALDEYEHRIVGITHRDAELAEDFEKHWSVVSTNFKNIFNVFGVTLGQVFLPIMDSVANAVKAVEKDVRAITQAFVDVALPGIRAVLVVIQTFGRVALGVFDAIKDRFDALAATVNKFAGTNISGADIIVGLILLRVTMLTIVPVAVTLTTAFYTMARAIVVSTVAALRSLITTLLSLKAIDIAGWILLFTQRIIDLGKALVTLRLGAFLQLLGGANPLLLALKLAVAAVAVAMLLWPETFGGVFKWFSDGLKGLTETALAFYNMLLRIAVLQGAISKETYDKLKTESAPGVPGTSSSGGGTSSEEFGRRVEQENPQLFQHHASGGPIRGFGRGDHVPVLAEPGEFMVNRAAVSRVGLGFMHALNNGVVALRMAAGGFVDGMASINPMPVRIAVGAAGGAASEPTAMFHLTFGDRTYRNLSAPQSTARDMHRHASLSARTQMAPAQSWKK